MCLGHLLGTGPRQSSECPVCKDINSSYRLYRPIFPQRYPYIPEGYMCMVCINRYEESHVADLKVKPVEELPLWIAHPWIFRPNAEAFQEILKNRLGIAHV